VTIKGLKDWPFYVWLFSLYAVLFLFSQNVGRVSEGQVLIVLGITLLDATLLFLLMLVIAQSAARGGVITLIISLALLTYGHAYNLIDRPDFAPILTILYVALAGVGSILILVKRPSFIDRIAPYLNLIGVVLVLMTLPPLVRYAYRSTIAQSAQAAVTTAADHPKLLNSAERPDIYYIILDAYSANSELLRDYGYDNSAFTDALETRGFYVADQSKTTYGVTVVSLAASLNMRYIDESDKLAAQSNKSAEDYFYTLDADSLVAQELQKRGYTYIFMLSGFTSPSTIADMNIDFHPEGPVYFAGTITTADGSPQHSVSWYYQKPFLPLFLDTTAFLSFSDEAQDIPTASGKPYLFWEPKRALATWDEAEKLPEIPEATFTIIHIIKPHVPLVFDRTGNILPYLPNNASEQVRTQRFFEQLQFVNDRTLEMLDTIIARSSTPPIIILQADHGSVLGEPESLDRRRTNFEILNAYHFPGHEDCITDRDIIPINSFRAMFNCYFDGNYPMLEHKYYAMPKNYDDLFDIEEIDIRAWEAEHGIEQQP
jgi:hypothetical protein